MREMKRRICWVALVAMARSPVNHSHVAESWQKPRCGLGVNYCEYSNNVYTSFPHTLELKGGVFPLYFEHPLLRVSVRWVARKNGSTRTGTRTQDQLIKSQLLYQLSYPRLHFRSRGAGRIKAGSGVGKLILGKIDNLMTLAGWDVVRIS